jgi:toxin ParE1/3/4
MGQVLWTEDARDDRRSIWDFIATESRQAAQTQDAMFDRAVAKLAHFPRIGRPGTLPNTRELFPHEHYRIVYQVNGELVIILALIHTARQWPPSSG